MNVSEEQIAMWRKERRRLKQQRDTLARRGMGRNIGVRARGSGLYPRVSDLDRRIAELESQLEAAGAKLNFWE